MKCPFLSKTDSYSDCDIHDVDGGCDTCHIAATACEGESAPNLCDDEELRDALFDQADDVQEYDPELCNLLEFAAIRLDELSKSKDPDPTKQRFKLSLSFEELVSFRENLIFVVEFCDIPEHSCDELRKLIVYLENLTSDRR
jgi:hypothetical protein